jgi:hypothetical protein
MQNSMRLNSNFLIVLVLLASAAGTARATVLPEDRVDLLYHSFSGGGIDVNGPSLLVRKQTTTNTSVFYKYYVDAISSASIDVVLSASRYNEKRTEQSGGIDYLHGKTIMSFAYTNSVENDYKANSYHFNLSQDFFGDLTTLSMGYSKGADFVSKSKDPLFVAKEVDRQNYRIGLSQIMSKNLIMGLNWETITDQGYLQSPYRSYSYCLPNLATCSARGFAPEKYPNTRTSNAVALTGSYFLPYRAAVHGELKFFEDSWGIRANSYELGYSHPIANMILDFRYRLYSQTKADFYSDNFDRIDQFNFMGRHKELSTFDSTTLGAKLSYEFAKEGWWVFEKGSLNLSIDHTAYNYKNFRDATIGGLPSAQPLYGFTANVTQFFVSLWY